MNKYEVLSVIGEGTYGVVWKCRNKETDEFVAIKKIKESEVDDPMVRKTSLREVKILRSLKHQNIVALNEAFLRKGRLYMVFEFMEKNLLEVLLENPNGTESSIVRQYVYQLCCAIQYCHANNVVHRDIKPENLLVNDSIDEPILRLCDFGFARTLANNGSTCPTNELTDYVATRWYRAPELLLGDPNYSKSVDIWAIGCIMCELLDGQPVFPGESEIDQICLIQSALGPLTKYQQGLFSINPRFAGMKLPDVKNPESISRKFMGKLNKDGLDFLERTLHMSPSERLTSVECLSHPYFDGIISNCNDEYEENNVAQPKLELDESKESKVIAQGKSSEDQCYYPLMEKPSALRKSEEKGTLSKAESKYRGKHIRSDRKYPNDRHTYNTSNTIGIYADHIKSVSAESKGISSPDAISLSSNDTDVSKKKKSVIDDDKSITDNEWDTDIPVHNLSICKSKDRKRISQKHHTKLSSDGATRRKKSSRDFIPQPSAMMSISVGEKHRLAPRIPTTGSSRFLPHLSSNRNENSILSSPSIHPKPVSHITGLHKMPVDSSNDIDDVYNYPVDTWTTVVHRKASRKIRDRQVDNYDTMN